jgi:DNA-binding CsgD family transcriptional regulator
MTLETGLRPPPTEAQRGQALRHEPNAREGSPPTPLQIRYRGLSEEDMAIFSPREYAFVHAVNNGATTNTEVATDLGISGPYAYVLGSQAKKKLESKPSGRRKPVSVHPYAAIPEEDVHILEQITIGKHPEQIGNKKEVESRIRKMRQLGVDFPHNAGGLTTRERAYIYHFQEGAKTTKALAEKLNLSESTIRGLRASLEKKFKEEGHEMSFGPDRTFSQRELELLDSYDIGVSTVEGLAAALNTSVENVRVIASALRKKRMEIKFTIEPYPFKKRLPAPTGSMSAA